MDFFFRALGLVVISGISVGVGFLLFQGGAGIILAAFLGFVLFLFLATIADGL